MPKRTACAFCGQTFVKGHPTLRESEEHLFRKKTLLTLSHDASEVKLQVFYKDGTVDDISPSSMRHVVSGICQGCNGGWMMQIDEESEEAKIDLATGRRTEDDLTDEERRALGLWAAKTVYAAFAMELGKGVIDSRHLRAFYDTRSLPKYSAAFIYKNPDEERRLGQSVNSYWRVTQPMILRKLDRPAGYKAGFKLDKLLIGFAHITEVGYRLITPPKMLFAPIHTNEPVHETGDFFIVQRDDLPLTELNNFMCNIGAIHSSLVPEKGQVWNGREIFMHADLGDGSYSAPAAPLIPRPPKNNKKKA